MGFKSCLFCLWMCCLSSDDEDDIFAPDPRWDDDLTVLSPRPMSPAPTKKGKERYRPGTAYTRGPNSPAPRSRRPLQKPATGPYSTLSLLGGASQSAHQLSDTFYSVPFQRPVAPKAASLREPSVTRKQFYELEEIDEPARPDPVHPGYRKDYYLAKW